MHPHLEPQPALAELLRQLPDMAAPPYGYAEFERRGVARLRAQQRRAGGRLLAVAAAALLCALVVLLRVTAQTHAAPDGSGNVVAQLRPGPQQADGPAGRAAELAERWLDGLPRQPAVVRVGTRAAVMGVEDRIAEVDDLLSGARAADDTERTRALQAERTRLMDTLVQVRYAQTLASAAP
jgi:hypothetical protein